MSMKPHNIPQAAKLMKEAEELKAQIVHAENANWQVCVQFADGSWVPASVAYSEPETVYQMANATATRGAKLARLALINSELRKLDVDVDDDPEMPETLPFMDAKNRGDLGPQHGALGQ